MGIEFPDSRKVRYAYHPKWSRVVQAMHSDGRRYNYTYDDSYYSAIGSSDGIISTTDDGAHCCIDERRILFCLLREGTSHHDRW